VVEVGWQDVAQAADGSWGLSGSPEARLVRPGFPISAVTSAVHHIADEDVAEAPGWAHVAPPFCRMPASRPWQRTGRRSSSVGARHS
jgi:exodeoxyribonuclease X